MRLGTAEETIEWAGSPAQCFERAVAAMADAGSVVEEDESELFIRGTTRYGLQKVRIKIKIDECDAGAVLCLSAFADDVWGRGARVGIRRFLESLGGP